MCVSCCVAGDRSWAHKADPLNPRRGTSVSQAPGGCSASRLKSCMGQRERSRPPTWIQCLDTSYFKGRPTPRKEGGLKMPSIMGIKSRVTNRSKDHFSWGV